MDAHFWIEAKVNERFTVIYVIVKNNIKYAVIN